MLNNLLILSHSYANFVKDPTEQMASDFKNINVLVRVNPVAEVSNFLPINYLKPHALKAVLDLSNKPSNINVIPMPLFYFPMDSEYKRLLNRHFNVADKIISKNRIKYDLIHAHFTMSAGYAGARLKEKYGIPFVVTAHGYDIITQPFIDDYWRTKVQYALNMADYVITVSKNNLKFIDKLGVKTPVKVIPNGFDNKLFYPLDTDECRVKLNLPVDKKIILSVGIMGIGKGYKYLVEAMQEIVKHRKDVLCIIIGDGALKNQLKKQIKTAGLEEHVKLAGWVRHEDICLWMNACDIFVLSSIMEGNPTVLFECLGCGKPYVGSGVGGVLDVITSRDYGLLVEPENPHALAEKMLEGLDIEWDRSRILAYAEQFSWKNVVKSTLKVYESVCPNTRQSR